VHVTAGITINLHRPFKGLDVVLTSFNCPIKMLEAIDANGMPTVVLTDDKMPGMTGCELASDLRQRGFTGQIVMLSGDADERVARVSGVNTLLLKPCHTRDLVPVLKAALSL
jgi:CheY-like chemotaxis protein